MRDSKKDIDMSQFVSDSHLITRHKKKASVLKIIFLFIFVAFIIVTVIRFGRRIF